MNPDHPSRRVEEEESPTDSSGSGMNAKNRRNGNRSKRDQLSQVQTQFLRGLASNLNGDYFGSYRDYSTHSREELLDLVSGKLTVEEVETVYSDYLLCHSSSHIADKLKPDSTNSILRAVDNHFETQESLYEVKVGRRYCDIVLPESLTAIEVKSARDRVGRSVAQLTDYSQWAEEVYLAYDSTLVDKIPQDDLEDIGAGLLQVHSGEVEVRKAPQKLGSEPDELLSCFTVDYLRKLAKDHDVASTGTKAELTNRLQSCLPLDTIQLELREFLKTRGASQI